MEQNLRPASPISAPYGHACRNCSRAKCKCVIRSTGGPCERCYRLKKECQPSTAIRKRNVKRAKLSKTAQLEEKLDDLVSLLKSTAQTGSVSAIASTVATWDSAHNDGAQGQNMCPPASQIAGPSNGTSCDSLSDRTMPTSVAVSPETACSRSPSATASREPEISLEEAEENLEIFRTRYLKWLPFTWISPSMTAQQLRQDRPFLWLCIMAVTSKWNSLQLALCNRIRQVIAQKIVIELEKSIDLLSGLLVYCAWGHCQRGLKPQTKPYMHIFTQLAISMIFGLGLNKYPPKESHAFHGCSPVPHLFHKAAPASARTLEERRAVLACFLITSMVSSYLQKIDTLRWTSHMDESLRILAEKSECPTDTLLVQQVRLQLISEKVAQAPWNEVETENTNSHEIPPSFYHKALQSQLSEAMQKAPPELQHNEIIIMHRHYTEFTIHQISLSKAPIMSNSPSFQRLESLYSCLNSAKATIDIFLNIETAEFVGTPFTVFAQFGHCLIALYKLSTLEDPAWDKTMVRNTADVLLILDQVIDKMRQAAELTDGCRDEEHMFIKGTILMHSLRQKWEATLSPVSGSSATGLSRQESEDMLTAFALDMPDDAWLNDMFMYWDC